MEQLRELLGGDLEIHTQVVLCPEWNDGAHLDETIEDLWGLGPGIRSLTVVPVGLTRYNLGRPVRLLTAAEAGAAIDRVDLARERSLEDREAGWCYAADEMYLIAERPLPDATYYDDGALHENGVGAVRGFLRAFDDGLSGLPSFEGRRIRVVTGASMAPFLRERAPRLAEAIRAEVDVIEVRNEYFGETVTVAGLLGGRDILASLGEAREGDLVLLPREALNANDTFIDDMPWEELATRLPGVEIRAGHEVTEALRAS